MDCLVTGCTRPRKRSWNKSRTIPRHGWWCHAKYCAMHQERKRLKGTLGSAAPLHVWGRPWLSSNGYLKTTREGREIYVHREVYSEVYGEIPPGYHVHHKDGDRLNNDPANLEAMLAAEHHELHRGEDKLRERSGPWCHIHPTYRGLRKPKSCQACWTFYEWNRYQNVRETRKRRAGGQTETPAAQQ